MENIKIDNLNIDAILEIFGKTVDNEGFLIEKKSSIRLICPYSKENIKSDNFSILPGSSIFVNNYDYCFAEHLAKYR